MSHIFTEDEIESVGKRLRRRAKYMNHDFSSKLWKLEAKHVLNGLSEEVLFKEGEWEKLAKREHDMYIQSLET